MFGSQKNIPLGESAPVVPGKEISMAVIPSVYYGGADPQIYHAKNGAVTEVRKEVGPVPISVAPNVIKKSVIKEPEVKVATKKSKKLWYILGGIFLLVSIGAISWYYLRDLIKPPVVVVENPPPTETVAPPVENTVVVPSAEEVVPISISTSTTGADAKLLVEFPIINLADSADVDVDALTDFEEEVFSTDSGNWDTDGDGYYDGQEIVNLYNPKGFAPVKIIDSGLVQEYVNPVWNYRLYYPANWSASAVDSGANNVVFSHTSGDYIEVVMSEKKPEETFVGWFARQTQDQMFADLTSFTNRFQVEGWQRQDGLVSYFTAGNQVFVLIYHPAQPGAIKFRHIMNMMTQSFRPIKTEVQIPDQPVLPVVDTATTSLN